jgi:hypothetical protein
VIFSKHQFYCSLGALLVFLVALNAVVAYTTRNSVPRRQMARARHSPNVSVLAIGNSLIGAGFDESAFDRGMQLAPGYGSLNFALGYSYPVEQLLFLRYALRNNIRPRIIIYGFYDLQLSTPIRLATGDLIGNRAVLYYLEPEYARKFYYLSPHDRVEFEIMRHFPMMVDRGAFWAKIERLRRKIGQEGIPPERTDQFGRTEDFSLLESSSSEGFAQACERATNEDLIAPILEIIRQGSETGARIVFVEMPMRPAHVTRFYETPAWRQYRDHVSAIVESKGVRYVNASNWISDSSLFADPLHLGQEGATQFSLRLGEDFRNDSTEAPAHQ